MKLYNINDGFNDYQKLIDLYNSNKNKTFDSIKIDLKEWFSANMSAVLGGILDLLSDNFNNVEISEIDISIKQILLKNNFLAYWGYKSLEDNNHTTIPFLKLNLDDGKFFKLYISRDLVGRDELPNMSERVKEALIDRIYELFVNAQIHSESKNIYTCGQFYPQKQILEFTIVDTGIGIKKKVNDCFDSNLTSTQAIKWALVEGRTTKIDAPGGIGLSFLKEFVEKNKGKLQIVSDDGFYEYENGMEKESFFNGSYPGTILNILINTNDSTSYYLEEEINLNDIF